MVTDDQELIKEILDEYGRLVSEVDLDTYGPSLAAKGQEIVKEKTGVTDPYQEFKANHMSLAEDLYSEVEEIINKADEPLLAALIMSAMGNAIDAGVSLDVDVAKQLNAAVNNDFAESDFKLFRDKLEEGSEVLLIGDNSGEAIFDKLLIKELKNYGLKINYAYREQPVLNDATIKEIKEINLDKIVDNSFSSGCKAPGTILSETNEKFKRAYKQADIVISKGQGNFEGLSEVEAEIFFLLKAKCQLVAEKLGVAEGDFIFKFKGELNTI
jgi:uncharacterized protein with ATP-grasp and redox domains